MNVVSLLIGIVALAYGVITIILRLRRPESFRKLEAMKKTFGDRGGLIVHTITYSGLPIVAGILALILGIQGKSFF